MLDGLKSIKGGVEVSSRTDGLRGHGIMKITTLGKDRKLGSGDFNTGYYLHTTLVANEGMQRSVFSRSLV